MGRRPQKGNPWNQATWNDIKNANGTGRLVGGNYLCVNTQGCKVEHLCYKCIDAFVRGRCAWPRP